MNTTHYCVLVAAMAAIAISRGLLSSRVAVESPAEVQASAPVADARRPPADSATPFRDYTYTQMHMAMPVRITVYARDERLARKACRAAFQRIHELEKRLSDYQPASEIRRLTEVSDPPAVTSYPHTVRVSSELLEVLTTARNVHQQSGGAFDPTAGPVVELWRQARKSGKLPSAKQIETARAQVGLGGIELDQTRSEVRLLRAGQQLDLGAIAKGFIADEALEIIQSHGIPAACIEAGGDFVLGQSPPAERGWEIDIPFQGTVLLSECGVSVSGDSAQFVIIDAVRYSHVVDPRTGQAVTSRKMAIVVAPNGQLSDALATAGCVMAPDAFTRMIAAIPNVQGWQHTVADEGLP